MEGAKHNGKGCSQQFAWDKFAQRQRLQSETAKASRPEAWGSIVSNPVRPARGDRTNRLRPRPDGWRQAVFCRPPNRVDRTMVGYQTPRRVRVSWSWSFFLAGFHSWEIGQEANSKTRLLLPDHVRLAALLRIITQGGQSAVHVPSGGESRSDIDSETIHF